MIFVGFTQAENSYQPCSLLFGHCNLIVACVCVCVCVFFSFFYFIICLSRGGLEVFMILRIHVVVISWCLGPLKGTLCEILLSCGKI